MVLVHSRIYGVRSRGVFLLAPPPDPLLVYSLFPPQPLPGPSFMVLWRGGRGGKNGPALNCVGSSANPFLALSPTKVTMMVMYGGGDDSLPPSDFYTLHYTLACKGKAATPPLRL